jgi:hypothetical protein
LNLDFTSAALAPENRSLLRSRLPPLGLFNFTVNRRQWTAVLELAAEHFLHEGIVPLPQRRQSARPSEDFRMMGVGFLAFSENYPNSMQLPVLTKQMLATKTPRSNIPDSQFRRPAIMDALDHRAVFRNFRETGLATLAGIARGWWPTQDQLAHANIKSVGAPFKSLFWTCVAFLVRA